MKNYRVITILLILITTSPFLILLKNIDIAMYAESTTIFWKSALRILSNVLGYIGTILLIWEFLLGIRQIVGKLSKDILWMSKVHQWLGKYGMLLVFMHPILSMLSEKQNLLWLFTPIISTERETHITYGRIVLGILIIIYVTSALLREKIKFRPWLYIHYLSYPILFFTFLHALDIGTFLENYSFLKILWFGMLGMYVLLLLYRMLSFAGFGSSEYEVESLEKQGGNIFLITLKPKEKALVPQPGQYFYLQLRLFGESHPFSVMEFDKKSKTLTFGIKNLGSFTDKLSKLSAGESLYIEGPYGIFTKEGHNQEKKIILAGGIGVTPFIELVKQYGNNETFFLYSNQTLNEALNRNTLKSILDNNYFDFISRENLIGENIIHGYVTPEFLKTKVGENNLNTYKYFICGSKRYINGMISNLKSLGVPDDKIFYEKFF